MKDKKICFAASSGGHYEQLMMLKPLMEKYDSFVITEKTDYSAKAKGEKTYYMNQVNRREKDFIWQMIVNTWKSIDIYRKEKPDVVICTGVLAMIPICLIAKLMGKKLIYEKTSEIAAQVGRTPQNWNSSVFSMIQNLSESVVVPIAGIHRCSVLLSYAGNAWYKQRGGWHGAADAAGVFLCTVREKRDAP